jgi:hypothetical protein
MQGVLAVAAAFVGEAVLFALARPVLDCCGAAHLVSLDWGLDRLQYCNQCAS